ncbi:813_t:CDS:2, partial [Funneliformis geosporum]
SGQMSVTNFGYPDYWDRDPNTWGNVNDWDIYWIEQPHSVTVNKQNSHSALAEELRVLKRIYDSTEPAYIIACDLQNKESTIFFGFADLMVPTYSIANPATELSVASCELPSHPILQECISKLNYLFQMENMQNNEVWMKKDQIISLKLESDLIDLELEIDRARFQVAQQGLQECADAEFDTMERERKKIRTEDQNNVQVSPLCAVTTPSFQLSQAQPQTSENKIRTISTANETEVKSTCNEESSSSPNQELEDTETIPPIIVNEDGDIMTDTKMMRDTYLRIRRDLCDHTSQKDWYIEDYNVSDGFRKYQISNIDKLVVGETFNFSSDREAI